MQKKWKLCAWLFGINFFLSAFTFGGGYVVVPMVRKYFVRKKELFSEEELVEMAATAQSSPGAIAINLSALAGYRTAGAAGAAVSCVSAVLPPLLILSAVSVWYDAFSSNPAVSAVLAGMQAGAAALMVDYVVDMIRIITGEHSRFLTLLAPACFAANFIFEIGAVWILLFSCALCLLRTWGRNIRAQKMKKEEKIPKC